MKSFITVIAFLFIGMAAQAEVLTLTQDNTIVLEEQVDPLSVAKVMAQAKEIDAKLQSGYPIYLFLNTPGGSIQAGVELIEFLNGLNRPVHTVTLFAASMGFQIAQHMKDRYIVKYGVLMSHKARGSFSGDFGGTISQIDTRYAMWLRRIKLMDQHTVDRTNGKQTLESYINAYSPELWLNGTEAVEQGYADKVVSVKCDASLSGTKEQVFSFGFFSITVVKSNCPIQTGVVGVKASVLTNQGTMNLSEFLEKNGKFGICNKEPKPITQRNTYNSYSYSPVYDDDLAEQEEKVELCAQDPKLTLQAIMEKKEQVREKSTKSLKDNVVYSY